MRTAKVWGVVASCLALTGGAYANTIVPVYTATYKDAVTGDNQFAYNGQQHWNVDAGADNYYQDVYERPTVQKYAAVQNANGTVSAAGSSSPTYFGYLDIVQGRYGFDSTYMYFAIDLYSLNNVGNDGTIKSDFGESTVYSIRFGEDPNGKYSTLLSATNAKDMGATYQTKEMFGYYDKDGLVGGPGGIAVVNEQPGSLNGYETPVIADGTSKDASPSAILLQGRRTTSATGNPIVEFVFNYAAFNELNFSTLNPDPTIDPFKLQYLQFEASRGLKGNSNYLWNDKYSFTQAGTPYDPLNAPQNIYELDTLRGVGVPVVPLPAAVYPGLVLMSGIAARQWRQRRNAADVG